MAGALYRAKPIAMHRIGGRTVCHYCLNRLLNLHCLTLYSGRRTWDER